MGNPSIQIAGNKPIEDLKETPYSGQVEGGYFKNIETGKTEGTQDNYSPNKSGGPAGSSSNYISNSNDPSDMVGNSETEVNDLLNNFGNNPEDFIHEDKNGMKSLRSDKLEEIYKRMKSLNGLRLMIAMVVESKSENKGKILGVFGEDLLPNSNTSEEKVLSLTESANKINQQSINRLQKGTTILAKKIQEHNDAVFKSMQEEAEDCMDSIGDSFENFFTSGGNQEEQLDKMRDANRAYRDTMEETIKSLNKLIGGAYDGINDKDDIKGDKLFSDLLNPDNFISYDDQGYIDINKTKSWILSLRGPLTGMLNKDRALFADMSHRKDNRDIIYAAFTEKEPTANKWKSLKGGIDADANHTLFLFDFISSQTLAKQKLDNQVIYLNYQIKKLEESSVLQTLANVFTALAVALALAATVVTAGLGVGLAAGLLALAAAGAGAASAGLNIGAAEVGDAVEDKYDPSLDTSKLPNGFDRTNTMESLESRMAGILGDVNFDLMDYQADGYVSINTGKLSDITKKLGGIQNAIRAIEKAREQKVANAQVVARTLSGLGAPKDIDEIRGAMEISLSGWSTHFQAISSNLGELRDAHNWENQQAVALSNAWIQFGISMGLAVVSAAVGAGIGGVAGAGIGFALGQAVGSSFAEYGVSIGLFGNDTAYGMSDYDPEIELLKQGGSKATSKEFADRLNEIEIQIYKETIKNGLTSIGDGYVGLNSDKLAGLEKSMLNLMNTAINVETMRNMRAKLANTVMSVFGGAAPESSSSELLTAHYENSLQTMGQLKQLLSEKSEVHNRIIDAEKAEDFALVKFVVVSAIAGAMLVAGTAVSSLTYLIFSIGNTLLSLSSLVTSIVKSALESRHDFGELASYANREADEARKATKEGNIIDRLDQMEANLFLDGSLIQEIGGGRWGINSGQMGVFSQKLDQIFRIRDAIAQSRKLLADMRAEVARAVGGIGSVNVLNNLDTVNFQTNAIAQQVLQNQMEALGMVIQRHNKMNMAEQQIWLNAVKAAITVASAIIGAVRANNSDKMAEIKTNLKPENNKGQQPSPDQPEVKAYYRLSSANSALSYYQSALGISNVLTDLIFNLIMQAQASSDSSASEGKTTGVKAEKEEKKKDSSNINTYGEGLDRMEQATLALQLSKGDIALKLQNMQLSGQFSQQVFNTANNLIRTLIDTATSVLESEKQNKDPASMPEFNKLAKEVEDKRGEAGRAAGAAAQANAAFNAATLRADKFQKEAEQSPNASNLHAYLDAVESQVNAADKTAQASEKVLSANENLSDSVAKLGVKKKEDKDLGRQIKGLRSKIKELKEELKKDAPNIAQVNQLRSQLKAGVEQVDRSILTSQVQDQTAEALVSPDQAAGIRKEMDAELPAIIKKVAGKELKLDEIKDPKVLQDIYDKLYTDVFKKELSPQLQAAKKARIEAFNALRNETDPMKKPALQADYAHAQGAEGKLRQKIKEYNRLVGKINERYKALTGMNLESASEAKAKAASKPAAVRQAKEARIAPVKEAPYQPEKAEAKEKPEPVSFDHESAGQVIRELAKQVLDGFKELQPELLREVIKEKESQNAA